jgi:EAL domain-containing protein (putative c-di-GMP-specific phosphodiesterase class I)/GGDEF domain-containing protein/sensor domain CHASE-containing protein
MPTFRRLRTKLTVLYAGLFAAVVMLISLVVYTAVSNNVTRLVREELVASGTVFDRVWALRTAQLENGAGLLSRDFGFREAIASNDQATIRSALDNLKVRLGIDQAFMIGADGRLIVADGAPLGGVTPDALQAMEGDQAASGVLTIGGSPHEVVSEPILAPTVMGWVVFAAKLDRAQMAALERLSAIPLDASVLDRDRAGRWSDADRRLGGYVDEAMAAHSWAPQVLRTAEGPTAVMIKPLTALSASAPAALLLSYPMSRAMAPYQPLLYAVVLTGLAGLMLLVLGSWALARSLTRPILALDEAATRLKNGERIDVAVETGDEIGRLAESFNAMAAEIGKRERRITHLALHDPDTDLPNHQWLQRHLERVGGAGDVFVAALGVDRYAHVRGAIGYDLAGDLVGEIGATVRRSHKQARVARLSTDVLGVVFGARDLDGARAIVGEMQAVLEAPVRLGDNTVDVSLTVGLASHPLPGERVISLIERANIALDVARAGRQKFAVFDEALYGDPAKNLSLMSEMRQSIAAGHMLLHHQPKYDLRLGAVTGVEALVRWRHPTRGLVPPDAFIGMAEDTGHIRPLTDWVIDQAVADQRTFKDNGVELEVAINISGRLLDDDAFATDALARLERAVAPICFEITETAVIEQPDVALGIIERFASAGVKVAIDDYGTGLSSLAYLKQIRANELKIDKSFVFAMAASQRDALLVRSTVDLAHGLGLQVTAEGVESPTALALLSGMGCDLAQGYLIARPLPLNELLTFMAEEERSVRTYSS